MVDRAWGPWPWRQRGEGCHWLLAQRRGNQGPLSPQERTPRKKESGKRRPGPGPEALGSRGPKSRLSGGGTSLVGGPAWWGTSLVEVPAWWGALTRALPEHPHHLQVAVGSVLEVSPCPGAHTRGSVMEGSNPPGGLAGPPDLCLGREAAASRCWRSRRWRSHRETDSRLGLTRAPDSGLATVAV